MSAAEITNEICQRIEGNSLIAISIRNSITNITMSDSDVVCEIKEMAEDNFTAIEKMLGTELTNRIINF